MDVVAADETSELGMVDVLVDLADLNASETEEDASELGEGADM